jgi:hypothetical protein
MTMAVDVEMARGHLYELLGKSMRAADFRSKTVEFLIAMLAEVAVTKVRLLGKDPSAG